jgi:hypothetical protein
MATDPPRLPASARLLRRRRGVIALALAVAVGGVAELLAIVAGALPWIALPMALVGYVGGLLALGRALTNVRLFRRDERPLVIREGALVVGDERLIERAAVEQSFVLACSGESAVVQLRTRGGAGRAGVVSVEVDQEEDGHALLHAPARECRG